MNKIKFETLEAEKLVEEIKNPDIDNLEFIFLQIAKIYGIEKPIIMNASIDDSDYNIYYNIEMQDKKLKYKDCIIAVGIDKNMPLLVKLKGKDYVDVFEIYNNRIYVSKKSYQNSKKKILFEKLYNINGKDYTLSKVKEDFIEFNYIYKNNYLNSRIKIGLKRSMAGQASMLYKFILKYDEEIKDIVTLCNVIRNILNSKEAYISITNRNYNAPNEVIEVDKDNMITYIGYITENDQKSFVEYHKNLLDNKETYKVTREENPNQEAINEIKNKVGRK